MYVSKDHINRAKEIDLLTFLQLYEPNELVKLSSNVYSTRTHDSLKISNGKWCWWSRSIGGRSALDYLIKVREMALPDAVNLINGQAAVTPLVQTTKIAIIEPKQLLLPERNNNNDRVITYLAKRGISRDIIEFCISTGRLYESQEYHNAVFVGFDPQGVPRYGMRRGTSGSRFMADVDGSDKRYSFSIPAKGESRSLHLFESAIDLLSYGTLELIADKDWQHDNLLSLAGIYKPKGLTSENTLPLALAQYLIENPNIDTATLHLDNDVVGRLGAKAIQAILTSICTVALDPPKWGKDVNDQLRMRLGKMVKSKEQERL